MNIGYLWNEVGKLGSFGENSLEEEDRAWDPGIKFAKFSIISLLNIQPRSFSRAA